MEQYAFFQRVFTISCDAWRTSRLDEIFVVEVKGIRVSQYRARFVEPQAYRPLCSGLWF